MDRFGEGLGRVLGGQNPFIFFCRRKNRMFLENAIWEAFGKGFGRVWGWFWEAQIHNFRIFFDVFSMLISKRGSKGEKNGPRREKMAVGPLVGSGFRWSPGPGERL